MISGEGKTQKGVKVFDASNDSSRKRSPGRLREGRERGYKIELKCASVSAFPAASLSVSVSASVHGCQGRKGNS